jgi:hypothetical protein
MVQGVLNNSLSTRLNKRTPMQVFTGHAETRPLALMLKDIVPVNAPLDFIKAQKLIEVEKLSKAMTEIHAQVAEKATRDRGFFVLAIVGFRGVRHDPGGAPDDSKLTGFGCFGSCSAARTDRVTPYSLVPNRTRSARSPVRRPGRCCEQKKGT